MQTAITGELSDLCAAQIADVNRKIQKNQEIIENLLKDKQEGILTQQKYETKSRKYMYEIDKLALKKEELLVEQGRVQLAEYRLDAINGLLQSGKILDEFDNTIFKSLVRRIKVVKDKEIEIEFECGIKVREAVR